MGVREVPFNVPAIWPKAGASRPLIRFRYWGGKRTRLPSAVAAANDPKRTWGVQRSSRGLLVIRYAINSSGHLSVRLYERPDGVQCWLARLITSDKAPTKMRLKAQVVSRLNQLRDTNLRPR